MSRAGMPQGFRAGDAMKATATFPRRARVAAPGVQP